MKILSTNRYTNGPSFFDDFSPWRNLVGGMDGTRTRDPLRDRQVIYPAELPHHCFKESASFPKASAKIECFFELAKHSEEKMQDFVQIPPESLFLWDKHSDLVGR